MNFWKGNFYQYQYTTKKSGCQLYQSYHSMVYVILLIVSILSTLICCVSVNVDSKLEYNIMFLNSTFILFRPSKMLLLLNFLGSKMLLLKFYFHQHYHCAALGHQFLISHLFNMAIFSSWLQHFYSQGVFGWDFTSFLEIRILFIFIITSYI